MIDPIDSIDPLELPERAAYLRLRPGVTVIRSAERLTLVGDLVWVYPDPPDELGEAVELLRAPRGIPRQQLATLLGEEDTDELGEALYRHGFLQVSDAPFHAGAPSPCRPYFEAALDAAHPGLAGCSFVIVGCGGIGCDVARHLVASGAGKLTLIDFDIVSQGNLNRQYLFARKDLGRPKIEAARAALLEVSADTEIEIASARIETVEDLQRLGLSPATAVLCCADTPRGTIGTTVHRYARAHGSWFGICSVGVLAGSWGPILAPGNPQLYLDVLELQGEEQILPEVATAIASFGPTNSLIAAAFTRDVVHAVLGDRPSALDHRVDLDFRSFERTRTSWAELAAARR